MTDPVRLECVPAGVRGEGEPRGGAGLARSGAGRRAFNLSHLDSDAASLAGGAGPGGQSATQPRTDTPVGWTWLALC